MTFVINKELMKKIDTLRELMFDSVGSFYIIDKSHRFITGNKTQLEWLKITDVSMLTGQEMTRTCWKDQAQLYIKNNTIVMQQNKPCSFIEYGDCNGKIVVGLSEKKPFYHDNKLIGIVGLSIPLSLSTLHSSKSLKPNSIFVDTKCETKLQLSDKHRQSLFLTLQGLTAKEIAHQLSLSKRTVEHHLERIKEDNHYASLRELLLYVKVI